MKDFISPMKKLYKICTQTNYYEQYEIEADSYEEAVDSVMETIHYGTDDYPMNVERLWYACTSTPLPPTYFPYCTAVFISRSPRFHSHPNVVGFSHPYTSRVIPHTARHDPIPTRPSVMGLLGTLSATCAL